MTRKANATLILGLLAAIATAEDDDDKYAIPVCTRDEDMRVEFSECDSTGAYRNGKSNIRAPTTNSFSS